MHAGKVWGVEDAVLSPVWMITGSDGFAFVRPAHSGICVSLCASKNVHMNGVCSTKVKEDVLGRKNLPRPSEKSGCSWPELTFFLLSSRVVLR